METDIELLESIVKVHNDFLKGCNNETINEKEIQAIENVLNRIKELEREIQVLENTRNSCPCIKTSGVNCDLKSFDANDCISKDKIRAKIEYYENALDDDFADIEDYLKMKYGKEVLKELLEE